MSNGINVEIFWRLFDLFQCQELCCCGKNKTLECKRKVQKFHLISMIFDFVQYHCYKKCPLSKASTLPIGDEDISESKELLDGKSKSKSFSKNRSTAKSRLNYPVLHSEFDESMSDFCFSTTSQPQSLFDDTQPYFLASTGSLEPTEKPLVRSHQEPHPNLHGIISPDMPQLPAVSSRIRWDQITNPLVFLTSNYEHVDFICRLLCEYASRIAVHHNMRYPVTLTGTSSSHYPQNMPERLRSNTSVSRSPHTAPPTPTNDSPYHDFLGRESISPIASRRNKRKCGQVSAGLDADGTSDVEMSSGLSLPSSRNRCLASKKSGDWESAAAAGKISAGIDNFQDGAGFAPFSELRSICTPPSTPGCLALIGGSSSFTHSDSGDFPVEVLQLSHRQYSSGFLSSSSSLKHQLTPLGDSAAAGGDAELDWFDNVVSYATI